MKVFECPKCRKRLANRHNLSRHKKDRVKRLSTVQQQLCNDIPAAVGGKRPINPDNASFDGITAGSGKSTNTGSDDHPKNPKVYAIVGAILNGDRDAPKKPLHEAVVVSSSSKRFDQIDILPAPASQVVAELIPASRTKGDIIGYTNDNDDNLDDDTMGSGSDATSENSDESIERDDEHEVPHSPPEVVEEVFSSMIITMPRTKEEIVGWCSGNESDEDEDVEEEPVQRNPKLELLPSTVKEL